MEVAAISVDSPHAHRVWAEQLNIPYPLVSDFGRELIEAYRVPRRDIRLLPGVASRSAFLVDATGMIRYVWYESPSVRGRPDVPEVLAAARALPR